MRSASLSSSDANEINSITLRWSLYSAILMNSTGWYSSLPNSRFLTDLYIGFGYGLAMASFFLLFSYPFRSLMARYDHVFEKHHPQLIKALVAIFVLSVLMLISVGIFFYLHPTIRWTELSLFRRMSCSFPIGLLLVSAFGLAYCGYTRKKRGAVICP
jgi:hypothetical protein